RKGERVAPADGVLRSVTADAREQRLGVRASVHEHVPEADAVRRPILVSMLGVERRELGVARAPLAGAGGEETHLLHEDASDDDVRPVEAELPRPGVEAL